MECHFDAIRSPRETKSFVKASLDVLRKVKASSCRLFVDIRFHSINVVSEVEDIESQISITDVSVSDKSDFNFKASIGVPDMVNDLVQRFFGALDPHAHRCRAIKNQAQV